jgi:uncharacterized protein DUF3800
MTAYALYIDDSGTKEYALNPEDYSRSGNSRYFVFGGVLVATSESGLLSERLKQIKRSTFGLDSVEIKSNWLRIPRERQRRYSAKYNVTDAQIEAFVLAFYDAIAATDLRLFAAIVDKIHVQEDYSSPWYAPAIAYEILLQRIAQEVVRPDTVSVIVDDMTGATPKGRQYRLNLERQHRRLCQHGSSLLRGIDFASILPGIRFVDSARSHLVQVSDIIAYNVYRQFVDHGPEWETGVLQSDGSRTLPAYKWFEVIGGKFCRSPTGRIQGYGVVKFPLRTRIRWAWSEE